MKRPMATVGFTYLAALVAATYFNADFAKIMSIIFFCAVYNFFSDQVDKKAKSVANSFFYSDSRICGV